MSFSHQDATDANDNELIALADTQQLDAFGRLRISSPKTLFDAFFRYDLLPTLFDTSTATGGTITADTNRVSAKLSTTTTDGSTAIIQSLVFFPYQPGKSLRFIMSGNVGDKKTNVRKRWGLFNENNGVFFEQDGSNLKAVVRSKVSGSVVDTAVNRSSWNVDKLDGTGPSGFTLDQSLQQIWIIDYQYLGSGRIRFCVNIEGKTITVHNVYNSNVLSVPWSQTGSRPVRAEIVNTGTTASSTDMYITCCVIDSEGGYDTDGIIRYVSNGTTTKSIGGSGTIIPIISLRKQSAYVNVLFKLEDWGVFVDSADDLEFLLIMNPSLTGASWTNTSGYGQIDVSATALSGGYTLYGDYLRGAASTPSNNKFPDISRSRSFYIGTTIAGDSEIATLAARNITSTSAALGRISYKEIL